MTPTPSVAFCTVQRRVRLSVAQVKTNCPGVIQRSCLFGKKRLNKKKKLYFQCKLLLNRNIKSISSEELYCATLGAVAKVHTSRYLRTASLSISQIMRYLAIPAFLTTFSWGKRIQYAAAETKFLESLLHSSGSIRAAITYVSAHGTFLASVFLFLHLHLHIVFSITAQNLCRPANRPTQDGEEKGRESGTV